MNRGYGLFLLSIIVLVAFPVSPTAAQAEQETVVPSGHLSFEFDPFNLKPEQTKVNVQIDPPLPTPEDTFHNVSVHVKKPDGNLEIIPLVLPQNGTGYFIYDLPTLDGNYTFQIVFLGESFANDTVYYYPFKGREERLLCFPNAYTRLNLSARSPLMEVNQPVYVSFFMETAVSGDALIFYNLNMTFIGPDGSTSSTMFNSNSPSTSFVPKLSGNWTIQLSFPGQIRPAFSSIWTQALYCQPATDRTTITINPEPYWRANTEGTWTQKASMRVPRSNLGVAVVDGKIYAIGGSTENGNNPNTVGTNYKTKGWIVGTNEEYDPTTNLWTTKKAMPTPRYNFGIAAVDDKIYCIGGITDYLVGSYMNSTSVNEMYDPKTNSWQTMSPAPIGSGMFTNVVNGKIYIIGGGPNGTIIQVYDPKNDSWSVKPSILLQLISPVSAVVDDKIYIVEFYADLDLHVSAKTLIYDTKTDSWSEGTPIPSELFQGVGVPWRGNWSPIAAAATTGEMAPKRIYCLFEQYVYSGPLPNLAFDPKNNSWSFAAKGPTNRQDFAIAVLNDTLYVIGGCTYDYPFPDDTFFYLYQKAVTEQYTPSGHGTPDPTYQSPTPTPSISPSPSPTPTAPTSTPEPTSKHQQLHPPLPSPQHQHS